MGDKESCFKVLVPWLIILGWPYGMYLIFLSPWASPSRKDKTSSQSMLSTSCMLNKHLLFFLPQCRDLRKCPYRATNARFIESAEENSIQRIWVLWDQPSIASLAKGPWPRADCRPLLSWEQVATFTVWQVLPSHSVTCFLLSYNLTVKFYLLSHSSPLGSQQGAGRLPSIPQPSSS